MDKHQLDKELQEIAEFYETVDPVYSDFIRSLITVLRCTSKLPQNGVLNEISLCYQADLEAQKLQAMYNLDQSLSVKKRRPANARTESFFTGRRYA